MHHSLKILLFFITSWVKAYEEPFQDLGLPYTKIDIKNNKFLEGTLQSNETFLPLVSKSADVRAPAAEVRVPAYGFTKDPSPFPELATSPHDKQVPGRFDYTDNSLNHKDPEHLSTAVKMWPGHVFDQKISPHQGTLPERCNVFKPQSANPKMNTTLSSPKFKLSMDAINLVELNEPLNSTFSTTQTSNSKKLHDFKIDDSSVASMSSLWNGNVKPSNNVAKMRWILMKPVMQLCQSFEDLYEFLQ